MSSPYPADARGPRSALTAIHFLLRSGEQSRWHQVTSDEVWHHSAGFDFADFRFMDDAADQARVREDHPAWASLI